MGNVVSSTSPEGITTAYRYDPLGRLTYRRSPDVTWE